MNDRTATQNLMAKDDAIMQARIFEGMIENFVRNYGPRGHYDRCNFERDLHILTRQMYIEAQAPLLKHVTELSKALSYSTTIKFPG